MADLARIKGYLGGFIKTVMRRVDYYALYEATVVFQNVDGTLELKPLDSRLPGMSLVPIALGIPGTTATVPPGQRVLFGFKNGDPALPYASLWTTTSAITLNISTSGNINLSTTGAGVIKLNNTIPTRQVACIGDTVAGGVITSGNPKVLA